MLEGWAFCYCYYLVIFIVIRELACFYCYCVVFVIFGSVSFIV